MSAETTPPADSDFRQLLRLLQRHADEHLDQWDRWRLPTTYGDVFVEIRRSPAPDTDPGSYDDVSRWLD